MDTPGHPADAGQYLRQPEAVCEWCVTYINRQAARLISRLQKDSGELAGKNIWEELPELVGSKPYEEYHRAVAEVVITGIRAGVARVMVRLGVDLKDVATRRSLRTHSMLRTAPTGGPS